MRNALSAGHLLDVDTADTLAFPVVQVSAPVEQVIFGCGVRPRLTPTGAVQPLLTSNAGTPSGQAAVTWVVRWDSSSPVRKLTLIVTTLNVST